MDYCAAFRPIFVYVTHLARNQTDATRLPFPFASVRTDLQKIILTVFQTPGSSSADFDQAWFPMRCWLGETLARLPHGAELCQRLVDVPEHGGSEFFQRLSRLLDDGSPELLKVYAACIELGFQGYYAKPGREADLAGYRAAVRKRLADEPAAPAPAETSGNGSRPGIVRAAAWLTPVAITIVLYCLYRMMLHDLYAVVVG